MSIIVLYESICCSLNTNALVIKKIFKDKAIKKHFFIFYDSINFYKKAYNRQIYNKATLISYIADNVYFTNILESSVDSNDN